MPFDYDAPASPVTDLSLATQQAPAAPEASPSVGATFGAAFRQDNTIGSAIASHSLWTQANGDFYDVDPTFNPYTPANIKGYEDHSDRFQTVYNEKAMASVKADIDQEKADQETLAKSGWTGTGAGLLAGVADLPSLIPAGEIIGAGRAGMGIGRIAVNGALGGAIAATAQEAGLHATQQTRTMEESLKNVGGAAILGGALGAGAGALFSRGQWAKAAETMETGKAPGWDENTNVLHEDVSQYADPDVNHPDFDFHPDAASTGGGVGQSAGAAAVTPETMGDYEIAGAAASAVAKSTAKMNPLLRTIQSPSMVVRKIANATMENPVYIKKNLEGEGSAAVETSMKQYNRGALAKATQATTDAYVNARKAGITMKRGEFNEEVGKAMRRGDQSNVPGVTEAAQAWRSHVFEPLKQEAIKAGMLPHDVDVSTADSYFSRQWNRDALEANEPEFKAIAKHYLSGALDKAVQRQTRVTGKKLSNIQAERDEIQMGILRRNSNRADRAASGAVDLGGVDEQDIVDVVRRFNNGERPAEPQNLTKWLKGQRGGIYDPKGELGAVLPEGKKVPGLFRKARRGSLNENGGEGLDDIALRAWQEGFFPQHTERPSLYDFLDAVDRDNRGDRVVREKDIDAARAADDHDQVIAALDRMGIDFKRPFFGTIDHLKGLGDTVGRLLDDMDSKRIAKLDEARDAANARGDFDFLDDNDRDDYLNGISQDIFNTLTGKGDATLPHNLVVTKRGPLKERTFGIPDDMVEKFLHSDVREVGERYSRTMSADVELTKRFGSADMADAFQMIRDDYQQMREQAGTSEAVLQRLNEREKADIQDLADIRDMLRGNFRPGQNSTAWAKTLAAARTFNYMKSMGGVLIGSFADAARPAMVHGLSAYIKDGIGPLISGLKGVRMAKNEAHLAGSVAEKILHGRLADLSGLTDPYSHVGPIQNFVNNTTKRFSIATGLVHWDDFWKTFSSRMVQNKIIRNAMQASEKGFASLPPKERAYMGYLGVGKGVAEDIGRLFAQHGQTLDGVHVANSDRWGDDAVSAAARRAFYAATSKDVDSIIITPGVGDVPVFAHTPLGKTVLQFKAFSLASHQRLLIRGLQEDKTRFMGGIVAMSAIGMFSYYLKAMESGQPISDNPGNWAMEGLDRSGAFAIPFEINNTLEKVGLPGLYTGASAMFPSSSQKAPASRYATRDIAASFAGPTFQDAEDAFNFGGTLAANARGVFTGTAPGLTSGDVGMLRRNTPFASLPYWRWMIDNFVVPEAKQAVQ